MDAIAGLANMRARNYAVPEVDKLKAKLIAGRIIPAIATTTAMATGFVCLELYKVLQRKPVEAYRNTFANLALPLFAMAEPIVPKTFKYKELSWTLWDRWILEGNLTVQQLLDWFTAKARRRREHPAHAREHPAPAAHTAGDAADVPRAPRRTGRGCPRTACRAASRCCTTTSPRGTRRGRPPRRGRSGFTSDTRSTRW